MKDIQFDFKKVSNENLSRFSEMYKLCLHADVDQPYFQWKYLDNPAGEVIAFEAVDENKSAGFYGVIPERYLVDGEVVTVFQSMDTMTHPNYQKRGLFTKLARMTYKHLAEERGEVFIVGIPGSNSFYGFVNKLEWKNIHNFRYIFVNRYELSLLKPFFKTSAFEFKYVTEVSEGLDALLNDFVSKDKGILPLVDKKLMDWKILRNPNKRYKLIEIYKKGVISGYAIVSFDDKGYIKLEMLKLKNENKSPASVVALASFLFKSHPSQFIYTWEPLDERLAKSYKKAGFIYNPFKKGLFSYRVPLIVYSNVAKIKQKDWFDVKNFDFQPMMQD